MSDALQGGTTPPDGGEQPGTPEGAGANASEPTLEALQAEVERLRAVQNQSLAEKSTLERYKRENEELRGRLSTTPPTGYGPPAGLDPGYVQQQALRKRMAELESAAAQGEPDSQLFVGLFRHNQQMQRQLQDLTGLLSTPQEDAERVMQIQREYAQEGEAISTRTAKKLLEAEKLAAKSKTVQQRDDELRRAEEARSRGVVSTTTVGVPAAALEGKRMSFDEFNRRTANMSPAQMREFDRDLVDKGVVVTPD
jgi:DNA repair exonuclease SbcCD ATPase subunit